MANPCSFSLCARWVLRTRSSTIEACSTKDTLVLGYLFFFQFGVGSVEKPSAYRVGWWLGEVLTDNISQKGWQGMGRYASPMLILAKISRSQQRRTSSACPRFGNMSALVKFAAFFIVIVQIACHLHRAQQVSALVTGGNGHHFVVSDQYVSEFC